jgi:hypothetical protein
MSILDQRQTTAVVSYKVKLSTISVFPDNIMLQDPPGQVTFVPGTAAKLAEQYAAVEYWA